MSELLSTGNSISKCVIMSIHWELHNSKMVSYLPISKSDVLEIEIVETLKEIDLKN